MAALGFVMGVATGFGKAVGSGATGFGKAVVSGATGFSKVATSRLNKTLASLGFTRSPANSNSGSQQRKAGVKKLSFHESVNFMIAYLVGIGTTLYLGHGVSDDLGDGTDEIKHLERISSLDFISICFLLVATVLMMITKGLLAGYIGVLTAEQARDGQHQLEDEDRYDLEAGQRRALLRGDLVGEPGVNLQRAKNRAEQAKIDLCFVERIEESRSNASFRTRESVGAVQDAEIQQAVMESYENRLADVKRAIQAEVEAYDAFQTYKDAELAKVFTSGHPKPKGLARLGFWLRVTLRLCFGCATLCSCFCTLTACVAYFHIFIYKASHASYGSRLAAAVAMSLVVAGVEVAHLLIIRIAILKD